MKDPIFDLETSITRALVRGASSEECYELVEAAVAEIAVLEASNKAATEAAADPEKTPNAKAAQEARSRAEAAANSIVRLKTLESRLRDYLGVVLDKERREKYSAEFSRDEVVHDAASARLATVPDRIQELVDILAECTQCDRLTGELHGRAPSGEVRRFDSFRDKYRALFERTVLYMPDGTQVWPPRTAPMLIVPPLPYDRRYSADWWRDGFEQRQAEKEQEAAAARDAEIARKEFYGQH